MVAIKCFVLICGLPNAGKTTFSNRFLNVIHMDDIIENFPPKRQTQIAINNSLKLLQTNSTMCLEGVFACLGLRQKILRAITHQFPNIYTVCIYIEIPVEIAKQRESRNRDCDMIESVNRYFQQPQYDEGWDEIIIVN